MTEHSSRSRLEQCQGRWRQVGEVWACACGALQPRECKVEPTIAQSEIAPMSDTKDVEPPAAQYKGHPRDDKRDYADILASASDWLRRFAKGWPHFRNPEEHDEILRLANAVDVVRYGLIEHDTLGCHVAKTGIYAELSDWPNLHGEVDALTPSHVAPHEPTWQMKEAGGEVLVGYPESVSGCGITPMQVAEAVYKRMIEAAPVTPSSTAAISDEMVEAVNALPGWSGFTKDDLRQLVAAIGSVTSSASGQDSELVERIRQFDSAIQRIGSHVGAVCGGVDTGPRGGHTAEAIIEAIDTKVKAAYEKGLTDSDPLHSTESRVRDE